MKRKLQIRKFSYGIRNFIWLLIVILINSSSFAQTWSAPINPAGNSDRTGMASHLLVVNGNPAISYYNETTHSLQYIRSADAAGYSWGTPVTIDVVGNILMGTYTGCSINSIAIVNNYPAISYYDGTNRTLKYVRANDANGTTWGTPVTIDAVGNVGFCNSLQIVNGNPAVSYFDETNHALKFIRSNDLSGITWSTPVTIDAGKVSGTGDLQIVSGKPATSYFYGDYTLFPPPSELHALKFVHAADASGIAWGAPVTLDSTNYIEGSGSLKIAAGHPAISYYYAGRGDLKYVRSIDPSGSRWNTPVSIDVHPYQVIATSLEIVSGKPAIAYYDYNYRHSGARDDLKYVNATDPFGSAWDVPITIDSVGITGGLPSLQIVNGNPAISYYDYTNGNLKYVRAKHATGKGKNSIIEVYPNPITGNIINLKFTDMPGGIYTVILINSIGQTVFTKQINHPEGTSTEIVQLKNLGKQVYQLEIIEPDKSSFTSKLIIY